jgi:IS30 family transposase
MRRTTGLEDRIPLIRLGDLDFGAHQVNGRPRQTLDWMTPSQKLAEALR